MTSNGSKTSTATWVGVLISAVSLTFAFTYGIVGARDAKDIQEIKESMKSIESKIDVKIDGLGKELMSRVETANETHKSYEIRLDRIETKVGIPR